ncbi:MAG: adenylate/guanylate cyclase domain-containing protein [Acidimicrobiales bacterium]
MVGAPSGTVTFLFTDLEGSTRLWEERPDEMRAALVDHDAIVRSAVDANDGYVFSTGGDGFGAAFRRAADAVAAAEQAQADLAAHPLLRVRMGINTGEVQERDGDYFGPPVNRTARLMAAGHGGQVLVSAVTAELVPGLMLKNLGEHRLRDLGTPMLVWQLGSDGFPPLRTLDELPGNLPVQRTSFIGRIDEVKALASLVQHERLMTLTGPGGVGKSRLALQAAAELAPVFHDGAWFASLGALEEVALISATILEALGVPERRGEPALDTLCSWAAAHEAMVVIDNCEHLAAAVAAVVDRILEASSTVVIMATSQTPLGVRGEHVWTVAPLSSGVARDSVELFVDRARMVRTNFELTDGNEAAIVEICERLDHVPLAIELAAARVRGMSPADIARRLDQRLRLLSSTDRSAPGRHRTLDAAVRWSYELCDDTQRRIFDRLSAFAGPFTIEAAEAVAAGDGTEEWEVLDAVLALVDKSLVVADENDDDTRYRLLETMRQFGQANLTAAQTQSRYRDRHADYYSEFVLSRRAQLYGSGDMAALTAIEREVENIRPALRQAADDVSSSRFDELYSLLFLVWQRDRLLEGATWAAEFEQKPVVDPAARIVALGFASVVMNSVDLAGALIYAQAAEDLWASTASAPPLTAISVASTVELMRGQSDAAIAHCERVVALAAEEPDLYIRAHALGQCHTVLSLCGGLNRLPDLERDVMDLVERLGNRTLLAMITLSLALATSPTDPARAGELLLQAYALNEEYGANIVNSTAGMFLALHELKEGNTTQAARWARRALELAVTYGPTYIAQVVSVSVLIVKRRSSTDAAVLLGALRTHRVRRTQTGTEQETAAEAHQDASLRRALGAEFEPLYNRGLALSEPDMLALAFTQLDAILDEAQP